MRRCQAYEKTNKIEEALADAKKVQELDPSYPKVINIIILFSSINSFIHSFIHYYYYYYYYYYYKYYR